MRIFKPYYKKTCNWCKYLSYGMKSDISECTITGEKIQFIADILDNKTCNHFKCCTCHRTLLDIIKENKCNVRVEPFFKWFDLWIGIYIDTKNKAIYIIPIPTLGIKISY